MLGFRSVGIDFLQLAGFGPPRSKACWRGIIEGLT